MARSRMAQARKSRESLRMATVRLVEQAGAIDDMAPMAQALARAAQATREALRPQSVRLAV